MRRRARWSCSTPRSSPSSDETNVYEEGCLSIPEQYAEVTRPKVVDVTWMDRDGNLQQETFDDLWATCVQHEIDHLNGKLFIDYLKPLKRQMITRKMQKLKARKGPRMTVRACLPWPDKRLRTKAEDVPEITDEIRAIWDDMIDTMEAMPGVGLAAPQIGVMLRLAVVDGSTERGKAVRWPTRNPAQLDRIART